MRLVEHSATCFRLLTYVPLPTDFRLPINLRSPTHLRLTKLVFFLSVNAGRKLLLLFRVEFQTSASILPSSVVQSVKHKSVNSTNVSSVLPMYISKFF